MKQLLTLLVLAVSLFAVNVGDTAPAFSGKTITGEKVTSETATPKMYVFWATWCHACKEEIPSVQKLYDEFNPQGLDVVAVNVGVNDSEKRASKFAAKYKMNYPILFDTGSTITRKYGVQGTPTIIIVDANGVVRYRDHSVPTNLGEHFESLLAQK